MEQIWEFLNVHPRQIQEVFHIKLMQLVIFKEYTALVMLIRMDNWDMQVAQEELQMEKYILLHVVPV